MRAPAVIRWPGVIKPGTAKNDIFASLSGLSLLRANIAGGAKGDELKKRIEAGHLGIGEDDAAPWCRSVEYLTGRWAIGARYVLLLFGQGPVGRSLQELEDLLRDGL